jgi:hypothetical protein
MIDFRKLTMGEISFIEDMSGRSISDLEDTTQPMGKLLTALACVAKRRAGEPGFTWNAALALTFDECNEIIGFDPDAEEEDEAPKDSKKNERK